MREAKRIIAAIGTGHREWQLANDLVGHKVLLHVPTGTLMTLYYRPTRGMQDLYVARIARTGEITNEWVRSEDCLRIK